MPQQCRMRWVEKASQKMQMCFVQSTAPDVSISIQWGGGV